MNPSSAMAFVSAILGVVFPAFSAYEAASLGVAQPIRSVMLVTTARVTWRTRTGFACIVIVPLPLLKVLPARCAWVVRKLSSAVGRTFTVGHGDVRETRERAREAITRFTAAYGPKYPKAVATLEQDADALLTFFDFPAEHGSISARRTSSSRRSRRSDCASA
jgi:hypothetical protein